MKTRFHPAAVVFWIVGAAIIVTSIPALLEIRAFFALAAKQQPAAVVQSGMLLNIWAELRESLRAGGELIGLGIVIELVDRIRRNALRRANAPDSLTPPPV